jgi:hypothetical protein
LLGTLGALPLTVLVEVTAAITRSRTSRSPTPRWRTTSTGSRADRAPLRELMGRGSLASAPSQTTASALQPLMRGQAVLPIGASTPSHPCALGSSAAHLRVTREPRRSRSSRETSQGPTASSKTRVLALSLRPRPTSVESWPPTSLASSSATAQGAEAASQYYFDKRAETLSPRRRSRLPQGHALRYRRSPGDCSRARPRARAHVGRWPRATGRGRARQGGAARPRAEVSWGLGATFRERRREGRRRRLQRSGAAAERRGPRAHHPRRRPAAAGRHERARDRPEPGALGRDGCQRGRARQRDRRHPRVRRLPGSCGSGGANDASALNRARRSSRSVRARVRGSAWGRT